MSDSEQSLTQRVITQSFASTGEGELCVGNYRISDLVEAYGTPTFIYDATQIVKRVELVRETLGDRFDLYYSIKANPCDAILRLMLKQGCGLEVASGGELVRALHAGCRPDRIIFAGPGKTPEEIAAAVQHGIGELHAESLLELQRIVDACREFSTTATVALRVNPVADAQGGAMRMGGGPAPFGIDEDCLEAAVAFVLKHSEIRLTGLHLFVGTQTLDYEVLLRQYEKLASLGERLSTLTGEAVETLDFGGGWGVPYFSRDAALNTDKLRVSLRELMVSRFASESLRSAKCIFEPGRFLVAEAGLYVCRVRDVKVSRGVTYVVTDGGMHHHLAASGNLGQTIKRNFPVAVLNRLKDPCMVEANIVGPLCTPLDTLARKLSIPEPRVGDLIGVFQSGAYALTASPQGFLSHPTPAEVVVDGEGHHLVVARGSWQDQVARLM